MLPSYYPKLPVQGLGKTTKKRQYIDPSSERKVNFGGGDETTIGKKIGNSLFNDLLVTMKDFKIPVSQQRKLEIYQKYKSFFNDINDCTNIVGSFIFTLSFPYFRKTLEMEKSINKKLYPLMMHNVNKFSSIMYSMAVEKLFDFHKIGKTNIVVKFNVWLTAQVKPGQLSASESEKVRRDRIGKLFLKFIRDGKYVENYIKYVYYGRVGSTKKPEIIKKLKDKLDFDLEKARNFQEIATSSIMMSTVAGFEFMIKNWGLLHDVRSIVERNKFKYETLDAFVYGFGKLADVLSVNQGFLDETAVYIGCIDGGSVFIVPYEPPSIYDSYEVTTNNRVKCIILSGTNNVIDRKFRPSMMNDQTNYYEKLKRAVNYSRFVLGKVYKNIMKELKSTIINGETLFAKYNLEEKEKIDDVYLQVRNPTIWEAVYELNLLKNKKLISRKTEWEKYVNKWESKITLVKSKTIFRVLNDRSSKQGNTYKFWEMAGIDMASLPDVNYHEIDCVKIHKLLNSNVRNKVSVCQ
jgi:hypothetical protein